MGGGIPSMAVRADESAFAGRADVAEFIRRMHEMHGFDPQFLMRIFSMISVNAQALKLINPPSEPSRKTYWRDYRRRNVSPKNIRQGARFMIRLRESLIKAEAQFGVAGEIIAAIIGVETRYGTYLGNFQTAEALATLGFEYPRRAKFFRKELEAFFLYARENNIDPLSVRGSYAGAFGIPQFLPSSYRQFAVDFNGDGVADLFSAKDAVGSVANFLAAHGWQRGIPAAYPVQLTGDPSPLLDAGIIPSLSQKQFADAGAVIGGNPLPDIKFALVDLEGRRINEYRAGTINYYALTRYNRSNKYAMAVFDLAAEIKKNLPPKE